ncbi:MAG: hypothetical protein Q8P56_01620 [Candidatus Uhrbacteria bacterium]|nr:hypothetical protein [Candidatus Uhrbacteria bacterium]
MSSIEASIRNSKKERRVERIALAETAGFSIKNAQPKTKEPPMIDSLTQQTVQSVKEAVTLTSISEAPIQKKQTENSVADHAVSLPELLKALAETKTIEPDTPASIVAQKYLAFQTLISIVNKQIDVAEKDLQTLEIELLTKKGQLEVERAALAKRSSSDSFNRIVAAIRDIFSKKSLRLQDSIRNIEKETNDLEIQIVEQQSGLETALSATYGPDLERSRFIRKMIGRLFAETIDRTKGQFEGFLTADKVVSMNEELLQSQLAPDLAELEAIGAYSSDEVQEILAGVRFLLSHSGEGQRSRDGTLIEQESQIRDRLYDLVAARYDKIPSKDRSLEHTLSGLDLIADKSLDRRAPDYLYQELTTAIQNIMIRKALRQISETLLGSTNDPNRLREIKDIIQDVQNEQLPNTILPSSNDAMLNSELRQLNGFSRWKILLQELTKAHALSAQQGMSIEQTVIENYMRAIGESTVDLRDAARNLGEMGSSLSIPRLLDDLITEYRGDGSKSLYDALEKLLKTTDEKELNAILQTLPPDRQQLLHIIKSDQSFFNRFGHGPFKAGKLREKNVVISSERLTRILADSGTDDGTLSSYYAGTVGGYDADLINEKLIAQRESVEQTIIDSKLHTWVDTSSSLLTLLLDQRRGDATGFLRRIATEGIGISDKNRDPLEKLLTSKTLSASIFERNTLLTGLLLLSARNGGKEVLDALLSRYQGSKEDPKRIRRIVQSLLALQRFNAFEFPLHPQEEIQELRKRQEDLREKMKASDKNERKKIKDSIDTLEKQIVHLEGLGGIEDKLTERVVSVFTEKLLLGPEFIAKVNGQIESLQASGLVDIASSLSGRYEEGNMQEPKNVLKEVMEHILSGDFLEWRYNHEQTDNQLSGLTEEQKTAWKKNQEDILIEINAPSEEEQRLNEILAIKSIVANAVEHLQEEASGISVTEDNIQLLQEEISRKELKPPITEGALFDHKKAILKLEAQRTSIAFILELQNLSADSYKRAHILSVAQSLKDSLLHFGARLAAQNIDQILKIFTLSHTKNLHAIETDDPLTLLKIGTEPQETCQSWRNGAYNECLLSYVVDSNKKALAITDDSGKILMRSILKLNNQKRKTEDGTEIEEKTIFAEKPYSLLFHDDLWRVFFRALLSKAQAIGSSITLTKGFDERTLTIFEEEAQKSGYRMRQQPAEIYIHQSKNAFEYSDALGGKISSFNRYQPLETVVTFSAA